jgi:tetratricopeptide (TPR) repeat protein
MSQSLQKARLFLQLGRYPEAASACEAVLALTPEDDSAHALLSLSLYNLGRFKEGVLAAREALRIRPDVPFNHFVLALCLVECPRPPEWPGLAIQAVEAAIAAGPELARAWALKARLRHRLQDWYGVMEAGRRGLQCDPTHEGCLHWMADASLRLGDRAGAQQILQQALSAHPNVARLHGVQAGVALVEGQSQTAEAGFLEALRLDPQDTWLQRGLQQSRIRVLNRVEPLFGSSGILAITTNGTPFDVAVVRRLKERLLPGRHFGLDSLLLPVLCVWLGCSALRPAAHDAITSVARLSMLSMLSLGALAVVAGLMLVAGEGGEPMHYLAGLALCLGLIAAGAAVVWFSERLRLRLMRLALVADEAASFAFS